MGFGLAGLAPPLLRAERFEGSRSGLALPLVELTGRDLMSATHVADGLSCSAGFVQDLQFLLGRPLPPVECHPPPPTSSSLPPSRQGWEGRNPHPISGVSCPTLARAIQVRLRRIPR